MTIDTVVSTVAIVLSGLALITAIAALCMVIGMKLSTHSIEWKPLKLEDPLDESDKEMERMDEEDSKTLEEALELQKSKKTKTSKDPLDEILEDNNF